MFVSCGGGGPQSRPPLMLSRSAAGSGASSYLCRLPLSAATRSRASHDRRDGPAVPSTVFRLNCLSSSEPASPFACGAANPSLFSPTASFVSQLTLSAVEPEPLRDRPGGPNRRRRPCLCASMSWCVVKRVAHSNVATALLRRATRSSSYPALLHDLSHNTSADRPSTLADREP